VGDSRRQHVSSLVDTVLADSLCAKERPVVGIEEEFELDLGRAGIVLGVIGWLV
jgi:hypothetical protein